jgi:hypothetical protein
MNNPNLVTLNINFETGEVTGAVGTKVMDTIRNTTSEKREALAKAFGIVQNPDNWKYPIDCVLSCDDIPSLEIYKQAIAWFTGSIAHISRVEPGKNTFRVTADGYYKTVGA